MASWQITGKCDGLTADPANNRLLAPVNEDGNSSLYVLTPGAAQGQQVQPITYTAAAGGKSPLTGGTDSITIQDGNIYIVGSAPAANSSGNFTSGALFKAVINADHTAALTPVLLDDAKANDATPSATAGATVKLNLSDPDSSNDVPAESPMYAGQVAVVGQGDRTLIFIDKIGTAGQVNTTLPIGDEVNDLVFATSATGTLFVTDTSANKIYAITGSFKPGTAFVAAPNDSGTAGFLATVDLKSGIITPIVVGMGSPHGILFVPQP